MELLQEAGFHPLEVLRSATYQAAEVLSMEEQIGSIRPGKLADLVVLDTDLTAIEPDGIRDTKVLATMVGGNFEYDAANLA